MSRVLPGWGVDRIKRLGASAAKLLVYYHPDAPNAADQERLVARVADECRAADLALFLEPLSFGLDGGRLTGEARRAVVIETARRLTALGADVLKAEFPYDGSVTDTDRWRDACEELDAATPIPWVLLSGGVDDATFERQVGVACAAGASGVLVGRSVWADAATMDPPRTGRVPRHDRARAPRATRAAGRRGRASLARSVDGGARAGARRRGLVRRVLTMETDAPPVRDLDLLVAGEINPDVVVTDPDPRPVFGQAERLVGSIRLSIGSSSVITACGAARLGLRVAMVGVVGDDELGRFMLEAMHDRGLETGDCRVASGRATGASVILGNGRERAILTTPGHDR